MAIMKFNFKDTVSGDKQELVQALTLLTKMSLNKNTSNILAKKYQVTSVDYNELNESIKDKCLTFSATQAGVTDMLDVKTVAGLTDALGYNAFERTLFSIQTATLATLLADTDVAAMAGFIQMHTVGLGDSMTFDIGTKALYDVEDTSYGNTVTRPRKHFKQPVTVTPSPKECSVQFDVVQMLTFGYDFGAEMAKIVLSIRARQYQDAVAALYAGTPLVGTPFYSDTMNKTNFAYLGDRVSGINGGMAIAYGSRGAYATASDDVTTGFSVQDELIKKSYIKDLYGIPSVIIDQALDTSNANFNFRVPNDKIIVTTGEPPVQLVQENYVYVKLNDGNDGNVMTRSYKFIFGYKVALVSGSPYGIQEL